jgi:hypothetical protein
VAAFFTRSRVPSPTGSELLKTRDTVAMETPAREATSRIVTLMNRLKEEKSKTSQEDVNVYMRKEKKEGNM